MRKEFALLVIGAGVEIVVLVLSTTVTSVPQWIAIVGYVAGAVLIAIGLLLLIIQPKSQFAAIISITARVEDGEGGYGRSINGILEAAWVPVEITAENTGTTDVRISDLCCELYCKRFLWKPKLVETLPYFHTDKLDWLLVAQGLRESRSVTFSRRDGYPWSSARVKVGKTLNVRVVATVNIGKSHIIVELPRILVKGPYSATSS